MINIAIVEDEIQQRKLFEGYLERFSKEVPQQIAVHSFSDGDELLETYIPGKYDILLLDIQMKRMDGMQTAQEIRRVDSDVVIMFVTNLVQYAVQGYAVNAIDFLVKPVSYDVFCQKLNNAIDRLHREEWKTVWIRTAEGHVSIHLADIIYVELLARRLFIHTTAVVYQCSSTMQYIEEKLNDSRFFRCHAGYLVNLSYVRSVGKTTAMAGSQEIPVSKHRRKEFLDEIGNYLGSKI